MGRNVLVVSMVERAESALRERLGADLDEVVVALHPEDETAFVERVARADLRPRSKASRFARS